MMRIPLVSVVTSVSEGGRWLRPSLESVLRQGLADWEFILIDDGSSDGSREVLEDLARLDARVRVFHQENSGLTRALNRGCSQARGEFIARHDSDDLSGAARFARQVTALTQRPSLGMVSCWSHALGPEDEILQEIRRPEDPAVATRLLVSGQEGPPGHGSVMFRRAHYEAVGGYREAFRYAQDWDLWLRLAELGQIGYVPAFLYAFRVGENSISATRRSQQLSLFELAKQCRVARLRGVGEQPILQEATRVSAERPRAPRSRDGNAYFIGKCLLARRDPRAISYLRKSVWTRPWSARSWHALLTAAILLRKPRGPTV